MPEYRFSLTRIFSYKDKIEDSVLTWENTGCKNLIYSHILRSDMIRKTTILRDILRTM